ncbi:sulfite oxidase [Arenibaculum sp.]|jgi:DMSO/TMAO reductase YedYZ molybdopterin-dependent catalytic subunit|uniref:SorT family sulfite dehydrogenase catalytic subunit n=1 Tax=Arenibaculum sp. TaxID=2865862 RepID=UPI002E115547|nr:sulfite oxidase [Arenibaculum sp.]
MHNAVLHRRHFIIGAAGTAGAVATVGMAGPGSVALAQDAKPLPDYVAWKDADAVIVHSNNTLEMKRGQGGTSGITPADQLYIRNNVTAPGEEIVADPDAWSVSVEGVRNPRGMTVGELKKLGVDTVAAVLQCSGNGRAFFDHEASGTQWTVGAAGNVLWSGVPVRVVVEELGGLADGAKFMTGTGGETIPEGIDPKTVMVERSVPVEAMENAILAWEMNGAPVPLAHGGPLRLVIPGYFGVNNVKYIKTLAFTEQESDAKIQQSGYRVRPVGVKGAPDQPSMWEMGVKSWVTHPLMEAGTGRVQIHGVAFGGTNPVEKVEVSTDGGQSWQEARFIGPDLGRYAWRPFVLAAELAPGTHTIASRATDSQGNAQPEEFEPNERGYGHNGWRDHAVDVTVG